MNPFPTVSGHGYYFVRGQDCKIASFLFPSLVKCERIKDRGGEEGLETRRFSHKFLIQSQS